MKRNADDISSLQSNSRKIAKILHNERSSTPLDINLTSNNESLSQDDVIYFQKQALYRLLNLQFNKNNILINQLSLINNNYSKILMFNNILIQWWFQILDELKILFNFNPNDNDNNIILNDDILLSLNNFDIEISNDELKQNLNLLHKYLLNILNKLFLSKNLKIDSNTDKILSLESEISSLTILKNNLGNENSLLKSNITQLNDKLESLIRKFDRSNSKSLNRIKEIKDDEDINNNNNNDINNTNNDSNNSIKQETIDLNNNNINNNNNNNNNHSSSVKLNDNNDSIINKSQIEEFQIKMAEINGKNEILQNQLDEKIKIIINLEKNINDLNNKLNNLNDDDLLKISNNYKLMIDENKNLNNLLNSIKLDKKKLENQMFELESKFSINKSKLESKFKLELENNNNYISKLENDINRIRSDRDSLNSKISILKNEKGKNELIENLTKLTEILQSRLLDLEKIQLNNLENLSTDDHNKLLINELKQIEQAFKNSREISINKLLKASESEILINKLTIEKSKADEKYFQSMRLKDSLSSQNKILNSNLNKQMELIEILKSNESELLKKLSIEEKIFENLNKIELMYHDEINKLNLKLSSLERQLIQKSENENDLRSQISKHQFEVQQLDKKLQSSQQSLASESKAIETYKSIIEKYRSGESISNQSDTNDSEIQEALLSMTKCSLCRKNFKNIALKTCGHCFCKDCVDDRLSARMRKCPSCNSQFSRYDLLNIHL
jgi:E3 ubiquitin-protein ligase BRE1